MRLSRWTALLLGAIVVGCAGAPPPPPPVVAAPEPDAALKEAPQLDEVENLDAPERAAPPSTKSYEEAMSTPESLDVHDDRVHLTDAQLTGPIRGVLAGCRVPSSAKVTIRTAVEYGRAIGVTVNVRFDAPKSAKRPSRGAARAAAKRQAKRAAKIITCADHAVRAVVWPPSRRRDSFTTVF